MNGEIWNFGGSEDKNRINRINNRHQIEGGRLELVWLIIPIYDYLPAIHLPLCPFLFRLFLLNLFDYFYGTMERWKPSHSIVWLRFNMLDFSNSPDWNDWRKICRQKNLSQWKKWSLSQRCCRDVDDWFDMSLPENV